MGTRERRSPQPKQRARLVNFPQHRRMPWPTRSPSSAPTSATPARWRTPPRRKPPCSCPAGSGVLSTPPSPLGASAPNAPPSCREPSVQIVSGRPHSFAVLRASSFFSTMMLPPNRLPSSYSCLSADPPLNSTLAASFRCAVRVDSLSKISSGPQPPWGLA